jgi:hypothetical protein
MTDQTTTPVENKPTDKELNFRAQEKALQEKYERLLQQERNEKEKILTELQQKKQIVEEEETNDEPYVDHKRLSKTLNKFGQNTQSEIQKAMELAKQKAKEELKQELWVENNPDFYDILQNHAEKLAQKAPKLAEAILNMPQGFDRQKLVYQNIKELGLDRPEEKPQSVQEKIDANKKSPYYQPTGVNTAPYAGGGDFSDSGRKSAYKKLQELKARLHG